MKNRRKRSEVCEDRHEKSISHLDVDSLAHRGFSLTSVSQMNHSRWMLNYSLYST